MNLRLTSSAIALVAMSAPAFADVTPEQVWQSWLDYYEAAGYEITESGREQAGDTLTLKDVTAKATAPDSQAELSFGTVTLTDTGDGKVRTVFSDRATGSVSGTDPDGKSFEVPFVLDMPGNSIVTSGAPEDITHEFDYPNTEVSLSTIKSGDEEKPLPIRANIVGSTGVMRVVPGAPTQYEYKMTADRMTMTADIESDEGERVRIDANLAALELDGAMDLPKDSDFSTDMNAAIKAGLVMNGTIKSGPLTAKLDVTGMDDMGEPENGTGSYDGKGFDLTFAMSQDGLVYQGNSDAFSSEFTGGQMPFPVRYTAESVSFDLQIPVMKADEAQPYKLAYSLTGVTIGDELWALFDPEAKLVRDPASFDMDLTGLARVNADLLDPAAMMPAPMDDMDGMDETGMDKAEMGETGPAETDMADGAMAEGEMAGDYTPEPEPFQPLELNINQLALSLLGANVTASGQLTGPEGGDLSQIPVGKL